MNTLNQTDKKLILKNNIPCIFSIIFLSIILYLTVYFFKPIYLSIEKIEVQTQDSLYISEHNLKNFKHLPFSKHKIDLLLNELNNNYANNYFRTLTYAFLTNLIESSFIPTNPNIFYLKESFLPKNDNDVNINIESNNFLYSDENIDNMKYFYEKIKPFMLKIKEKNELNFLNPTFYDNQIMEINDDIITKRILFKYYFGALLFQNNNIELLKHSKFNSHKLETNLYSQNLDRIFNLDNQTILKIWDNDFKEKFGNEMHPFFKESLDFIKTQEEHENELKKTPLIFRKKSIIAPKNLDKINQLLKNNE